MLAAILNWVCTQWIECCNFYFILYITCVLDFTYSYSAQYINVCLWISREKLQNKLKIWQFEREKKKKRSKRKMKFHYEKIHFWASPLHSFVTENQNGTHTHTDSHTFSTPDMLNENITWNISNCECYCKSKF